MFSALPSLRVIARVGVLCSLLLVALVVWVTVVRRGPPTVAANSEAAAPGQAGGEAEVSGVRGQVSVVGGAQDPGEAASPISTLRPDPRAAREGSGPAATGSPAARLEGGDLAPPADPPTGRGPWVPQFQRFRPALPGPLAAEPSGPASGVAPRPPTSIPGLPRSGTAAGARPGSTPDWLLAADTPVAGKLNRRSSEGRSAGVRYGSGTPQSEAAVERGLRWLVAHQRDDGSWHFDHRTDACMSYCTQPGSEASTTASTAMALLPMLGAGYTHRQGEYQDLVQRGLDYLRSRGVTTSYGFDMRDGSMYGHALATIVLCETYAMTQDPLLRAPAQGGIRFIEYVQDTQGGGWRYNPGEPGDTTVTGWMLAALKSGQMAKLEVATPAIFLAERFLSSVQNEDGSMYGYMTRQPRHTTTAEALLCRMYTGWRRDHPGIVKGVAHLAAWGPAKDDIYYDYYATQVMFHWAGPQWDAWNQKMRDFLIAAQDRAGHAAGSWYFEPKATDTVGRISCAAGGRLYATAMATMILEVYYRYTPLYSEGAVTSGF